MNDFLNKFNIMPSNQYGFVTGRGTRSLLKNFTDELHYALEKNQVSCALFLDVSKSFHTVNHTILLDKLFSCGFRDPFF